MGVQISEVAGEGDKMVMQGRACGKYRLSIYSGLTFAEILVRLPMEAGTATHNSDINDVLPEVKSVLSTCGGNHDYEPE
jgi:hypothetical protein